MVDYLGGKAISDLQTLQERLASDLGSRVGATIFGFHQAAFRSFGVLKNPSRLVVRLRHGIERCLEKVLPQSLGACVVLSGMVPVLK